MDDSLFGMGSPPNQEESLLFDQTLGDATIVLPHQRTPSDTFYRGSMPQTSPVPTAAPEAQVLKAAALTDARQQGLQEERDRLRLVNGMLEHTIQHFQTAQSQISRFEENVGTTHALLDTYVRILSQTDANAQLLLDGSWELDADLKHLQLEEQAALIERAKEMARLQRQKEEREGAAARPAAREPEAAPAPPSAARGSSRGRGQSRTVSGSSSRGASGLRYTTRGRTASASSSRAAK